MEFNYIDLFCGAGGFSLGFKQNGFKNIFSNEFNPNFAKTYTHNFEDHKLIIEDIKNVTNDNISSIIGKEKIDVVIGGPPCQGFSLAGNIGRTFVDDDRNKLFLEYIRVVNCVSPKMFIMENVAAMATHNKGQTIKDVINKFEKAGIGYKVVWKVLNSVNYGIAQERRRIFIVGVRNDININFEFPIEIKETKTIKYVIDDLPILKNGEHCNSFANHNAMKHSCDMLEKMSCVKDGGNRNDIPIELRPKSGDARKYIRYDSNKPSICITGDMRKVFHYNQNRALTPRELARVQSFPDNFEFIGTSTQIQQQIGNAVPPILANKIAKQVRKVLEKHEQLSKN